MKKTAHEHIEGIFSQKNSPLQKIFALYKNQQALEEIFYQNLPQAYHGQVKFLLYKAGVMSLEVPNSALYTRFNYEKANLFNHFKTHPTWAGLREIKIKVKI